MTNPKPAVVLAFAATAALLACNGQTDARDAPTAGDAGAPSAGNAGAPGGAGNAGAGGLGGAPGGAGGVSGRGGTNAATGGSANAGGPSAAAGDGGATSELVNCDPRAIVCKRVAPTCGDNEVPSVDGSCYGACVRIERCGCDGPADCPNDAMYTCWNSAAHCGPYVR